MYTNIYEISIPDILPIIIIALIIILICISIFISTVKKKFNLFAGIVLVVILFFSDMLIISGNIADSQIYISYLNNDYSVVEGNIENLISGSLTEHTPESFYINGIYFEYNDNWEFGYSKYNQLNNGEELRISYIYDEYCDTNRIVKIEKFYKTNE